MQAEGREGSMSWIFWGVGEGRAFLCVLLRIGFGSTYPKKRGINGLR